MDDENEQSPGGGGGLLRPKVGWIIRAKDCVFIHLPCVGICRYMISTYLGPAMPKWMLSSSGRQVGQEVGHV